MYHRNALCAADRRTSHDTLGFMEGKVPSRHAMLYSLGPDSAYYKQTSRQCEAMCYLNQRVMTVHFVLNTKSLKPGCCRYCSHSFDTRGLRPVTALFLSSVFFDGYICFFERNITHTLVLTLHGDWPDTIMYHLADWLITGRVMCACDKGKSIGDQIQSSGIKCDM